MSSVCQTCTARAACTGEVSHPAMSLCTRGKSTPAMGRGRRYIRSQKSTLLASQAWRKLRQSMAVKLLCLAVRFCRPRTQHRNGRPRILQNSSFLMQQFSFSIHNSSVFIQNSSFLMQKSTFLLTTVTPRCPSARFAHKIRAAVPALRLVRRNEAVSTGC